MNLDLKGKTAIVGGSTQGLGFASAVELALLGANVVLLARNEDKLKEAIRNLPVSPGQHHRYLVSDFNDSNQLKSVIEKFISEKNIVHILVNNTGGPPAGPALSAGLDEFLKAFNNHLICNQILVQAVTPGMKKEKFGRIINVISTSVKQPIQGLGVSNTIRAAVANWSKTLATELGPFGITVNNVLPGLTNTVRADAIIQKKSTDTGRSIQQVMSDMVEEIPAGRIGEPNEFGAAVAFLASPAAGYINGINLPVDGGRTACL